MNKRGVALLMVLGTVLVVVILANVIIAIISSQSRLTHHQVSRIQAYYAAQAGMNYALEMLRRPNGWTQNSCPPNNPCSLSDSNFPPSIVNREVSIVFCPRGQTCTPLTTTCIPPAGINFCINITSTYTGPTS